MSLKLILLVLYIPLFLMKNMQKLYQNKNDSMTRHKAQKLTQGFRDGSKVKIHMAKSKLGLSIRHKTNRVEAETKLLHSVLYSPQPLYKHVSRTYIQKPTPYI